MESHPAPRPTSVGERDAVDVALATARRDQGGKVTLAPDVEEHLDKLFKPTPVQQFQALLHRALVSGSAPIYAGTVSPKTIATRRRRNKAARISRRRNRQR